MTSLPLSAGVVFLVSATGICLELLVARILGLKTWSHFVYFVIPFAMLGYGVGCMVYMLRRERWRDVPPGRFQAVAMGSLAALTVLCTYWLPSLPLHLDQVNEPLGVLRLASACVAVAVPFIPVGLLVTQVFSACPGGAGLLYFWDLVGAAAGAALFYPMIHALGIHSSLLVLAGVNVVGAVAVRSAESGRRSIGPAAVAAVAACAWLSMLPEGLYVIDRTFGFEWIPGHLGSKQYELMGTEWNPIGKSDLYRITDSQVRESLYRENHGTFQVNIQPPPPFAYFTTNFRAGTPVYNYAIAPLPWVADQTRSGAVPRLVEHGYKGFNFIGYAERLYAIRQAEGAFEHERVLKGGYSPFFEGDSVEELRRQVDESSSGKPVSRPAARRVVPLSQPMEFPYLLLRSPRVFVIGAGGGRDIAMAKINGAARVVAAEVNPFTHGAMSTGGVAHDYSGRVYAWPGVDVKNMDGRALVAAQASGDFDLVVLNGVDTFSALSNGAYALAENYLYTEEAIQDYFRIVGEQGLVNFNRWLEPDRPRETLRLFIMTLDVLRRSSERPWDHVVIGGERSGWGMLLAKKSPFAPEEVRRVRGYFESLGVGLVYAPGQTGNIPNVSEHFSGYVDSLKAGRSKEFIDKYWADVSVVTDDNPFFFKHYRLRAPPDARGFQFSGFHPAGGKTALYVQRAVLVAAALFTCFFLFLPLAAGRPAGALPTGRALTAFWLFFAGIGVGFMFIEIALMQKLSLLLGHPIHAISVTLGSILLFTGLGSFISSTLSKGRRPGWVVKGALLLLISYMSVFCIFGPEWMEGAMTWSMAGRAALASVLLFPAGLALGVFFPCGLSLIESSMPVSVPWAWGINAGFSVLGATLSGVLAQHVGFSGVLMIATLIYVGAAGAYFVLDGSFRLAGEAHVPPFARQQAAGPPSSLEST